MTKTYDVDLVGVSRFLYSADGVAFLDDQTRSYFPYWQKKRPLLSLFAPPSSSMLLTAKSLPPASWPTCLSTSV